MTNRNTKGKITEIKWLPRTWYPVPVGFIPSQKHLDKFCKRMKVPKLNLAERGASTHSFQLESGGLWILVGLNPKVPKALVPEFLVHETIHVWQNILEHIGEVGKPSKEAEAYNIQTIFSGLYEEYKKASKK